MTFKELKDLINDVSQLLEIEELDDSIPIQVDLTQPINNIVITPNEYLGHKYLYIDIY